MTTLTPRQADVLMFIRQHVEKHQSPPTMREIAAFLGSNNPTAALSHVRALIRKGYLESVPGVSRGIRLVRRGPTAESLLRQVDAEFQEFGGVTRQTYAAVREYLGHTQGKNNV